MFVTVRNHEVPWIPMDKRIEIEPLGRHCWQVIVHYGFKNDIDLPRALDTLRAEGLTVLLVDQMAALALALCDRAYVMEGGRIVSQGSASEIAADGALAKAYLGAA